jgi:hypothetical protein
MLAFSTPSFPHAFNDVSTVLTTDKFQIGPPIKPFEGEDLNASAVSFCG